MFQKLLKNKTKSTFAGLFLLFSKFLFAILVEDAYSFAI